MFHLQALQRAHSLRILPLTRRDEAEIEVSDRFDCRIRSNFCQFDKAINCAFARQKKLSLVGIDYRVPFCARKSLATLIIATLLILFYDSDFR